MKKNRRKNRFLRAFIFYSILSICGVAFFQIGSEMAFASRGYRACGGEILFLLLPLLIYFIVRNIRDFIDVSRNVVKDSGSDTEKQGDTDALPKQDMPGMRQERT